MDETANKTQASPIEPSLPLEPKSNSSQRKTVKIVLVVFSVVFFMVIAVLGVMAYIQSTKKSEKQTETTPTPSITTTPTETDNGTQNWLTFTSTDFGILIKYPPDWETRNGQSFENGDLFSVVITGETQRPQTELYDGATLAIANPITVEQDYKTWAKDYYTTHRADETQPLEFSNETINGIEYLKVYTCGLGCFTYYITEKGDYVYQIVTSADGPSEQEYNETLKKMLTTIEFSESKMTVMPSPPPGALSYLSQNLGVGFFYPQKVQNIQSVDVKESGSKIYVFMTNTEPEEGQWVEVFSKNPDNTLSEAIRQHFLAGKDESKCYVTVTKTQGTITTAIIDFPNNQSNGLDGMFEKTNYCSEDYAKTNGIRYFWYDSAHPETYLFFSIGQYGIPVSSTENWQDTVKIIRMRE